MSRLITLLGLSGLVVLVGLAPSAAQDKGKDDLDRFRDGLRKPESALDYWNRLTLEVDFGRLDLAAANLKQLLALPAAKRGKKLLDIVEQDGLTEVLKLRNVPRWSKDDKIDKEAKDNVRELIKQITEANAAEMADEGRIRAFVKQLQATKEERDYALRELAKIGAAAVPALVESHIQSPKSAEPAEQRQAAIFALERLGPSALPPMLAALDSDNELLKRDLLDIFRRRYVRNAKEIVPHLWFPSASPKQPQAVRDRARKLIAYLEEVPEAKLPVAKVALVREAERYYNGDVAFPADGNSVWRWDGTKLVEGWPTDKARSSKATATQASGYYGLRFAQQALALDPTYKPAQEVFLAHAIDKASPGVNELVGKASAELLLDVLDRGLKDKRPAVILAAVQALGDRAEVRAKRPLTRGDPGLVRALYYPDARVQLAAAEALLRIPGPVLPKTSARVVEVLKNALSPATTMVPGRKVLVAVADQDWRNKAADAVQQVGARAVQVTNGRDAQRSLRGSSGYEAVLMSSDLPYPGLAHLLAQMDADRDVPRVPILVAAVPTTRAGHEASRRYEALRKRRDSINAETVSYRAALRTIELEEREARQNTQTDKSLRSEERNSALQKIAQKAAAERRKAADDFRGESRLLADLPTVEAGIAQAVRNYDREVEEREASLSRFLTRYPQARVVHATLMTDAKALDRALGGSSSEASAQQPAARLETAERAIQLLSDLAAGRPKGYDVKPAAGAILDTLRLGRLSPDGQLAAIRAASYLGGARAQQELAAVVRAEGRGAKLRAEAASALLQNVQRQGRLLTAAEVKALAAVSGEKGVDAKLKDLVDKLSGALAGDAAGTGERLRDYQYRPRK